MKGGVPMRRLFRLIPPALAGMLVFAPPALVAEVAVSAALVTPLFAMTLREGHRSGVAPLRSRIPDRARVRDQPGAEACSRLPQAGGNPEVIARLTQYRPANCPAAQPYV